MRHLNEHCPGRSLELQPYASRRAFITQRAGALGDVDTATLAHLLPCTCKDLLVNVEGTIYSFGVEKAELNRLGFDIGKGVIMIAP